MTLTGIVSGTYRSSGSASFSYPCPRIDLQLIVQDTALELKAVSLFFFTDISNSRLSLVKCSCFLLFGRDSEGVLELYGYSTVIISAPPIR